MRAGKRIAPLAWLLCMCLAAGAFAQTRVVPHFRSDTRRIEGDVLAALNGARTQPGAYVETLMGYRGFFQARLVVIPSEHIDIETQEGTVPVDEAIGFMQTHAAAGALEASDTLAQSAADLVAEQGRTGTTGHFGADGSSPGDRAVRHGGGKQVAEVIAYGAVDAQDVIRQLLVDDGVPDRGHRIVMFSGHLRYAGVACGPHPEFGTMCVIDMADTPDGKLAGAIRRIRVAAEDETPKRR